MNNQIPYGYMPQFQGQNCQCNNQMKNINERIETLERQIRKLERKVNTIENNMPPLRPTPISNTLDGQYSNNYML